LNFMAVIRFIPVHLKFSFLGLNNLSSAGGVAFKQTAVVAF